MITPCAGRALHDERIIVSCPYPQWPVPWVIGKVVVPYPIRGVLAVSVSNRVEKRLTHEVKAALSQQDKCGESKHAAKQAARKLAQDTHSRYTPVTGLYATTTHQTYCKQAMTALRAIADAHDCRNIAECRPYVEGYYRDMCDRRLSAWTIHTRVYALCSVYGEDYHSLLDIEHLPPRHRADIMRGRNIRATNDRYNAQHHQDTRTLAHACGARRGGLMGLTAADLHDGENGTLRVHLREKGGKERDALVLPDYADKVREIFARYGEGAGAVTGGKRRLLPLQALPKDMPLHYLRARYAQDLYRYYVAQGAATGQLYHCRAERVGQVYDKGVLMAVSKNLGHSRCDVVVSHYLYR